MLEKSDLNSEALICGMATEADGEDDGVDVVVDELHPETTSPNESTAPVSATDLRAVPIDIPSIVTQLEITLIHIVPPSCLSATAQERRYQTVTSPGYSGRRQTTPIQ
jgi:hypothetical protein